MNRQLRLGMLGTITAVFSQFKWQDATANNLNLQNCRPIDYVLFLFMTHWVGG
jgi:hypothetical protein